MGEKLKDLRIKSNMTQQQVANRVRVAVSAVSSYESGVRYPSYDVLIKLSGLFHVSTDYLLGIDKSRNIDVSGLGEDKISVISQLVEMLKENESDK